MNSTDDIATSLAPYEAVVALSTQFQQTGDPQYLCACARVLHRVIDQPSFFNSLLWSINRHLFIRYGEIEKSLCDEIRYQHVGPAYFKFVDTFARPREPVGAPPDRGSVDRVLIVSHQFLHLLHSPSKICFDYAKTLRQTYDAEVMVQNTVILPWQNVCGFVHGFVCSRNPETKGVQRVRYEDTTVSLFTAQQSGVDSEKVQRCLQFAVDFQPTLVLAQGEFNLIGDLLATLFPTICLPMSRLEPISAAHTYIDYAGYYDRLKIVEHQLIPHTPLVRKMSGVIPSPTKQKHLVRADFGLDDADFVFVIVGVRIQTEIDEQYEQALAQLLGCAGQARLLLIGVKDFLWRTDAMRQLADRVTIRKSETDLVALFELCDCMLNPVRSGGGYTALMAVHAALPVLSLWQCDVGGILGESNCCRDLDDIVECAVCMVQDPVYHRQSIEATTQLSDSLPSLESIMGDLLGIGRETKAAFAEGHRPSKQRQAVDDARVSVLIVPGQTPTQVAGKEKRENMFRLLDSVQKTLAHDKTPYEIICLDDGTVDRTLVMERQGLSPYLRFVQGDPGKGGDQAFNSLVQSASADILVILDWDAVCLTDRWVSLLCDVFDNGPKGLGSVGAKRLNQQGNVHSYGELLFYPVGCHSIVEGGVHDPCNEPVEADHIGGGLYAIRREMFDDLGGFDETFGGPVRVDFSLRARMRGWLCQGISNIEVQHDRDRLVDMATAPDAVEHIKRRSAFATKWGFDWVAPDLRAVLGQHADTPLVWNRCVRDRMFQSPSQTDEISFEQSSFGRYQSDPALQQKVSFQLAVTERVIQEMGSPTEVVQVGAGDGLLAHLLATKGLRVAGIEEDLTAVRFAQQTVSNQNYPGSTPQFIHRAEPLLIPLKNNVVSLLLLFDCLERDINPVGLLREARRVVRPNGIMIVITPRPVDDPSLIDQRDAPQKEYRYQWLELVNQIRYLGGWQIYTSIASDDTNRDMVVVARKIDPGGVAAPDRELSEVY